MNQETTEEETDDEVDEETEEEEDDYDPNGWYHPWNYLKKKKKAKSLIGLP